MKDIFESAQQIQDYFDKQNWRFCFIGGVALQRWAKPRLTNDADLTLLTGFGSEAEFIDRILEKFEARINNPLDFALQSRVLLLKIDDVGIDISLGALYFEFIPNIVLKTCSAEDLIVFKAFADRLQDWADIQNILSVQKKLDWNYIFEQLEPLIELKEEPEILSKLNKLKIEKL